MATFTAGTSFTDGVTGDVTAAKLNALVANATPLSNFITDRTAETSIATDDLVLISDTSDSGALNKMTVANLMKAEITGTINSTTGTITNLSTTLAGDMTISQGTSTLGTTGVTASTYGTTSDIPRITVDAKGRITSATTVTNPVGFRNRIINGDMRIDQRNAGASVTLTSSGDFPVDRFVGTEATDGVMTAQRDTDAPSGFSNSIKFTTTTADTSLSSTQYCSLRHSVEGFNVADFGFGSASAKTITISFWVRSSLTGTFGGAIQNASQNRSYPFTYAISSANTWEQKTVTIAGDTSGTWGTGNGVGISIWWGLGVGSSLGGTAGAWNSNNNISATGAVSVIGTLNATWYITGVQLEAGSTATDFERRPYGTELALCQRYYQKVGRLGNPRPIGTFFSWVTNDYGFTIIDFPVEMRAQPTSIEQSGTASHYGVAVAGGAGTNCDAVPTYLDSTVNCMMVRFDAPSGHTSGQAGYCYSTNSAGFIAWSAEL